jgi:hypothetical protein
MPPRLCIGCPRPAMPGRSRCSSCAKGYGPSPGPRLHDSRQNGFRQAVLKDWKPGDPCGKCGLPIHSGPEAGHIIARSQGGTFDPSNGQPEHRSCNRAEGARLSRIPKDRGRGGQNFPAQ